MNSTTNLSEPSLITRGFSSWHQARKSSDDWDNEALHVSDLHGCAREVWARRNNMPLIEENDDTERKFEMGRAFEDQVREALEAELSLTDVTFKSQVVVDQLADGVPISGHIDFVLYGPKGKPQPLEVKTTTFYPTTVKGKRTRIRPTEASLSYRVQGAAYAIALGADDFRIVIACRESGMMAEFLYRTEHYRDFVREKYAVMVAKTGVGKPEPMQALPPADTFNAKTGVSWKCASYCRHLGCERNTNPAALTVPE